MIVKKIVFIFFLAFIVRGAYAWFFVEASNLMLEDQAMYIQFGKTIAETGNFLQDTGSGYAVVTGRLPGYPVFLSVVYTLFGESNIAVVVTQIFIDSLTCVIIALIAELAVTGVFMVAGIISALNLNMVILSGMILTDTLFLFLFSLFILLVFHYIKYQNIFKLFLAISILSLSVLVRPVSYYLIFLLLPLLVGYFIWRKVLIKQAIYSLLLYIIPIAITLGPIHYRNYYEYNSFSLTSQSGGHALGWIVPATYQYSGQGSYKKGQILAKSRLENATHKDGLEMPIANPFEHSSYKMKVAKELLVEIGFLNILHAWSSGAVVNLLTPSIAYAPIVRAMKHPSFYATPGNGAIEKLFKYITNTDGWLYLLIITIGAITSLVFLIISMFGLYKMIKIEWPVSRKSKEIILLSLYIIIYFIAITGPVVGVKYRLPIEPIMTIFFSYALVVVRKHTRMQ